MSAESREQLRLSLLRILGTNPTIWGLPELVVRMLVVSQGHPGLPMEDMVTELQYLEEAGLVRTVAKEVSPEVRSWKVTKAGRDFLAERGIQ